MKFNFLVMIIVIFMLFSCSSQKTGSTKKSNNDSQIKTETVEVNSQPEEVKRESKEEKVFTKSKKESVVKKEKGSEVNSDQEMLKSTGSSSIKDSITVFQSEAIGSVLELEGSCFRKVSNSNDYSVLKKGDIVYKNDEIKTIQNSRLKITFVDESTISIGSKSKFIINSYVYNTETKDRDVGITILEGRLKGIVSKILNNNNKFEIKSKTMVVGIRGTEFIVYANSENQTSLGVVEGEVEVYNPKDKKISKVFVKKNQFSTTYDEDAPVLPIELSKELLIKLKGDIDSLKTISKK